jgi:protein-S-isoprenylcysteine O-methyltransferase Ste14
VADSLLERLRIAAHNLPLPEAHLIVLAASLIMQRLRRLPCLGASRPVRGAGAVTLGAGGALAAWAVSAAGTIDLERPSAIVTSGPYAFTRHPMYLAWTGILVGLALWRNNGWLAIGLLPLVVVIDRDARDEERRLAEHFGEAYAAYVRRVPRYLSISGWARPPIGPAFLATLRRAARRVHISPR